MKKVSVQAELDREYMYEEGEKLGLTGEALNMFRHFNFVDLDLLVDEETGVVHAWYGGGVLE
jgi:hypothetical protein